MASSYCETAFPFYVDIFFFISVIIFLVWVSDSWCWWSRNLPTLTLLEHSVVTGCRGSPPNVRDLVYKLKHVCFYLKMEAVVIHCEQSHNVLVGGYQAEGEGSSLLLPPLLLPSLQPMPETHNLLEAQRWSSMWFSKCFLTQIYAHMKRKRRRKNKY